MAKNNFKVDENFATDLTEVKAGINAKEIRDTYLFKRLVGSATVIIKSGLIIFAGIVIVIFVLAVLVAGFLPPDLFPHSVNGYMALESLFLKVVESADTLFLILLGYFFRDHMLSVHKQLSD